MNFIKKLLAFLVKKECISDEEDMDGCPKSSSKTGDLKSLKSEKLLKGVNPSEMFTNDLESCKDAHTIFNF